MILDLSDKELEYFEEKARAWGESLEDFVLNAIYGRAQTWPIPAGRTSRVMVSYS